MSEKRMRWFAIACWFGLTGAIVSGAESLRVMTFNVRYDNFGDGLDNWKFRANKVAGMFAKHSVQVAGLQEVEHHQLVWLRQALPAYEFVGVGRNDGKTKGEYAPVAFLKAKFKLLQDETIWLSENPQVVGSKGWDAALPRIVTFALLEHLMSGSRYLVGSVHYDHVGVEARKNSGAVIRDYITANAKKMEASAVIVAGDFNCLPNSEPFKAVEAGESLVDSYKLSKNRVGPNSTWNGFRAVVPDRRIDYVFVNKSVVVDRHVIDDRKINGRFPSDHLPVIVDLQVKE